MTNLTDIRSSAISAAGAGLTVYATKEDLPSSGLTAGDQAYVSASSRLYVSNGSGWYNVALINATPSLSIDPTGTIALSITGETTTITLTATDSDNAVAGLTYSVDSDGSFGGLATISQDSSVFTITPLSEESATTTSAVLTFKASDGINFGSGDRTFTLTFKVQYSNYTTLLLKNEETTDNQVDASTNTHTITENGNVTSTALSPYHPGGYSTYFDGNDYISAAYNADWDFVYSGDFTVSFWMYGTGATSNLSPMGQSDGGGSNPKWGIYINDSTTVGTGKIGWHLGTAGNVAVDFTMTANEWHYIEMSRSGNTWYFFANGTPLGTVSSTSRPAQSSAALNIGRDGEGYRYFTGYLTDVRIVSGSALNTSSYSAPTERLTAITNTDLLVCHLPYIADGSTNSYAITVNGDTSTKRFGPYDHLGYAKADHGGSVYFDGSGDYLSVAGSNLYSLGSVSGEPFTIEFWFNYSAVGTQGNGLITKGTAGSTGAGNILAVDLVPGTRVVACTLDGTYSGYELSGNTALKENTWNHIALVKNSSNVYKLYINGKQETATYNATGTISASSNFYIGTSFYSPTDANRSPTAHFSDVRVVSDAVYTTNFTPPTEPLTAITNTELLTTTNKNDIWDAGSGALITKSGNVTGGANSGTLKFDKTAVYFDGTGDYLSVPTDEVYNFGTGDFTIEAWVYPTVMSGDYFIASSTGTGGLFFGFRTGTNIGFGRTGEAWDYETASGISTNSWYHVAFVRSNSTVYLFVNGTAVGSPGTHTDSYNLSTTSMTIGSQGANYYYNGYIQDLRITNGLARYTSNFTPPTAEFDG